MRVLPDLIVFAWDKGNSDKNFILHKVSNQEAEEVFLNETGIIFDDEKHSQHEKRYMIWGTTNDDRLLSIFFTIRADKIRIISARDMHKKERRRYEEIKNNA